MLKVEALFLSYERACQRRRLDAPNSFRRRRFELERIVFSSTMSQFRQLSCLGQPIQKELGVDWANKELLLTAMTLLSVLADNQHINDVNMCKRT